MLLYDAFFAMTSFGLSHQQMPHIALGYHDILNKILTMLQL